VPAPRVLLGNLEPMVRLGMSTVLAEEGIDIVGSEPRANALVLVAGRLRPDAVVLDLARTESRDLAVRVREASPQATVLLWTRDEDVMEVVAPGDARPRRVASPEREALVSALSLPRGAA
jgi:DNA-binding NarL/FixJ family response regulator